VRWHPADVNSEVAVTPGVTASPRKDISVGIMLDLS
jgi:hypothetical protein